MLFFNELLKLFSGDVQMIKLIIVHDWRVFLVLRERLMEWDIVHDFFGCNWLDVHDFSAEAVSSDFPSHDTSS